MRCVLYEVMIQSIRRSGTETISPPFWAER
ncbi:uncharacterized protein METZ01_LOCUS328988, partial [marine metagenome]